MPSYRIPLSTPVSAVKADELAKRMFYVSQAIDDFALVSDGGQVTTVEVTTSTAVDPGELARKVDLVVATDVLPQRALSTDGIVWRSPHPSRTADGVFDGLLAEGAVVAMGEGMYATGEGFTRLLDALDRRLRAIAVEDFGAVRYRYPTLVSTRSLRRGGYLDAFPQFLMSACRLHADVEVYRDFVEGLSSTDDTAQHLMRFSEHSGYCLPPTMCFHTYGQLADARLARDNLVVTSRGKSFRFESRYRRSLERLWDFTIREIVFLGDEDTVAGQREQFMAKACDLVTELGLGGHVEVASDPFFGSGTTPTRLLAQRLMKLKYELRLPVEQERTVAVGSFNLHGTTFGEAYGITLPDGRTAHSACVGFGLERLAFAFVCQHGTEPGAWPAAVRAALGPAENGVSSDEQ